MSKLLENLGWRNKYGKWDYAEVGASVTIYVFVVGVAIAFIYR